MGFYLFFFLIIFFFFVIRLFLFVHSTLNIFLTIQLHQWWIKVKIKRYYWTAIVQEFAATVQNWWKTSPPRFLLQEKTLVEFDFFFKEKLLSLSHTHAHNTFFSTRFVFEFTWNSKNRVDATITSHSSGMYFPIIDSNGLLNLKWVRLFAYKL